MSGHYTYLVSSLPMLQFDARPPITVDRFIDTCRLLISAADVSTLENVSSVEVVEARNATLRRWCEFDTGLRNELVRIRSERKKTDPERFLRGDGYAEPEIARVAQKASRIPSVLDAERFLDRARWRALDELEAGHYFDLDVLIVYMIRLMILDKWERVRSADKPQIVADVVGSKVNS
ncbi:MAG: DUF2764 family protein [Candidatus Zixiibacteriota bacterium]|nr:MAG: DUF2764 family protein [candidate division Zixibacteria bacterium]